MAWAPAYASAADLAGWLGVDTDPQLALATETASRAIDKATGRQFGLLSSSEFRWFTAEWFRDQWIVDIDDLMNTTGLTVETVDAKGNPVAEVTDYLLTPRNAASKGRPYTRIEILSSSTVKPDRHGVQVTARWGWTEVPQPIKLATLIQAARLYERRENTAGQLTDVKVDDVGYKWSAGASEELDPDVLASIRPYVKLWAAA